MLAPEEVRRTLDRIASVTADCEVQDLHVHPFDVLLGEMRYPSRDDRPDLFSASATEYVPPQVGSLRITPAPAGGDASLRAKFFLLTVRRLYAHTGPAVLADQMALAGVSRCLLLPVAGPRCEDPFPLTAEVFGSDPRFLLGYSPPADLPIDRIADVVGQVKAAHTVRALKVHPGVSEIDVGQESGVARVEAVLEASRVHDLPVVIHAGSSPYVRNRDAMEYGALRHLRNVDWTVTDRPVVLAHAGAFGVSGVALTDDVLPLLQRMLDRFEHLMFDVSGLEAETLETVLGRVGHDRALFGSDALYYAQWETAVTLAHALERTGADLDAAYRTVACRNPARVLGES